MLTRALGERQENRGKRGTSRSTRRRSLPRTPRRSALSAVFLYCRAMDRLRLARFDLREIGLPLVAPFETSFGRTTERRIMIVRVWDEDGAVGYGESTASEDP